MLADSDFEAWYRREQPCLVRALAVISGDRDIAADLVDEAFSRALAHWNRVSQMESPGGWVRVVALNLMRRSMRRRALEQRVLRMGSRAAEPEPAIPDTELWAAVRALPARQREVVVLRYVADCTESETAVALGISVGAASASLVKARRRLAQVLDPEREVTRP